MEILVMTALMVAFMVAQATPTPVPWTAYITLVDFEGDGDPERVLVEPWYDGPGMPGGVYNYGHVQVEREDEFGVVTTYDFYGELGDALGGSNHDVVDRPLQGGEALLLSTENDCSVVLYWDGVWDTLPYTMKYVACQ